MNTSFELDVVLPRGAALAAFTRPRATDDSVWAPWRIVIARPRQHACTITTSNEARALLIAHGAEHVDHMFVARGISRLYRRNVAQIAEVADANVVVGFENLEVFAPMVARSKPLSNVQVEIENLAFEIACLLADDDGRETSLDLPHAWEAVAASLTTHVAYDALRGFYDEYQELRHRLHTRSATFSAAARRARLLAAVALSESRIPAFENVVIGLSAP
jgi:hypothetical protein